MYYSTSYSSALGVITMASDGDKLIMWNSIWRNYYLWGNSKEGGL